MPPALPSRTGGLRRPRRADPAGPRPVPDRVRRHDAARALRPGPADRPALPHQNRPHHPSGDRMTYRNLGRTGVRVSPLTLGAMMFGAWGNPDHDASVRIIHRALDAGHQRHRHRRRLRPRRVGGDRRQGAQGPARRGRARHQVPRLHVRRGPQHGGQLAPLDHPRRRGLAAAAPDRPHRPLPGAPPASRRSTSTTPSARCPTSCTPARSATSVRRRSCPRRSSRPSGWPGSVTASARSPSSRRTASWPVRWSATCCRPRRGTDWGSCPGRRWRAGGSRVATAAARTPRSSPRAPPGSRRATTRRRRRTGRSWRRCTRCRTWPTRPGCR